MTRQEFFSNSTPAEFCNRQAFTYVEDSHTAARKKEGQLICETGGDSTPLLCHFWGSKK